MKNDNLKKYSTKHIGETFISNEGYTIKITDGGNVNGRCIIELNGQSMEVLYGDVKKGEVKNPFHPSIHNKGFIGVGKYKVQKNKKRNIAYSIWASMLRRVYSEKSLKSNPTYKNVVVCSEWHNFQNFAKWFYKESNYSYELELDKDLLSGENKIYSPNTCVFIPRELNLFISNKYSNNASGYAGVTYVKRIKKWAGCFYCNGKRNNLGNFSSKELASSAYKKARKTQADKFKVLYENILPKKALEKIK